MFRRILCQVDSTRASAECVSQALILAGGSGRVTFSALERDDVAAATARRAAGSAGVRSEVLTRSNGDSGEELLEAGRHHDLLVVSAPSRSRAAGILLGATSSLAVHAAPVPVLVARLRADVAFPGPVLAATSGATDTDAVLMAASIAAAHGTALLLAHATSTEEPNGLARQAASAAAMTGRSPTVLSARGEPGARLPGLAASTAAGLVVVGSSGRRGVAALASVSERVAHRAPCSVLVLRSSPQ